MTLRSPHEPDLGVLRIIFIFKAPLASMTTLMGVVVSLLGEAAEKSALLPAQDDANGGHAFNPLRTLWKASRAKTSHHISICLSELSCLLSIADTHLIPILSSSVQLISEEARVYKRVDHDEDTLSQYLTGPSQSLCRLDHHKNSSNIPPY